MLDFDINEFGRKLGGWDDKSGQAAKYKSSDSNYRTYKPLFSRIPDGGIYLTMKIDHIRGVANDDHANVELWIGSDGQFTKWRVTVAIAGNLKFDTGLVTATAALISAKAAGIAFVVASIVNSLSNFMATVTDHGGRAHFPGVVQWNIYKMGECLRGAKITEAGPIADKHAALGGTGGMLGAPVSNEAPTVNNDGRYRRYERGIIFWSPSTGAYEVHGEILKKYEAFGNERGVLGYPLTDESPCMDGSGRYNHFQGGSILFHPSTGAWETHGSIRDKYAALRWERGVLGYPITDETPCADQSGRFNHYQHGTIFWHPTVGAFEVHGSIRDRYAAMNWERGPLGYPLSDETDLPTIVGSIGKRKLGRYNKFQHGYLCWTPEKGVWQTDSISDRSIKITKGVKMKVNLDLQKIAQ